MRLRNICFSLYGLFDMYSGFFGRFNCKEMFFLFVLCLRSVLILLSILVGLNVLMLSVKFCCLIFERLRRFWIKDWSFLFFFRIMERNLESVFLFFIVLFNNVFVNFLMDVIGVFSLWEILVIKFFFICFNFFVFVMLWKMSIIFFYLLFGFIIGMLFILK